MKVSIIIPAFNEEDGLELTLDKFQKIDTSNYEIIVVDDDSNDGTREIAKNYKVRLIRHPYNKGYGASLKTGIRQAKGDIIVIMDADGQHDPDCISGLLAFMDKNDMVIGARDLTFSFRDIGKFILHKIANYLSGQKIPDLNSGFRAIKRKWIMEFINILPNGFSFSTTITLALLKAGYNVKFIPLNVSSRYRGKSTVRIKDGFETILLILRTIMLFNPLKVFMPIFLFLSGFGTIFSIYGIVKYHNLPRTGVIILLTSVMVFVVGILADQISMIRFNDRNRNPR